MKKLTLALTFLLFLWGCKPDAPEAPDNDNTTAPINQPAPETSSVAATPTPEKIKESKILKGTFRGFIGGEVSKISVELADDETLDEWLLGGDETLKFFLAARLDKPLEFTYNVLEGSAGTGTVDKVVAAKDGNLTHEAWWQAEKAKTPDESVLRKKYQALVEQATEKDDDEP